MSKLLDFMAKPSTGLAAAILAWCAGFSSMLAGYQTAAWSLYALAVVL